MRSTEARILTSLANGHPLTQTQLDDLTEKIGKGQTKSRARRITDSAEIRYAAQIGLMTAAEQQVTQQAITNYSQSSAAINASCRGGAPNAAALGIDQMFAAFTRIGHGNPRRIAYRLMTYAPGDHVPYGSAGPPSVSVGDAIVDAGFVSASENRQLLVSGVNNPAPGSSYVKVCIMGLGGVNISGGSQYNNANEQALLQYLYPKTWRVRTAHAGQAEILYPRNLSFQVLKVTPTGNDVHVTLWVAPGIAQAKNSYTGL